MAIQLTTPRTDPKTGLAMPCAMARNLRIDPELRFASYEMYYGDLIDGQFKSMVYVDRYSYRDTPEEQGLGTDPETGVEGVYVVKAADPAFSRLVSMARHEVTADDIGKVISAYDLISENAIYTHEMQVRPELFGGTIL